MSDVPFPSDVKFSPAMLGISEAEYAAALRASPETFARMLPSGAVQSPTVEEFLALDRSEEAEAEAAEPREDDGAYILEFALTYGGEVLRHEYLVSGVPDGTQEWAWRAFLEGVVASSRGRAALKVGNELARGIHFDGEEFDEDDMWSDEDEWLHGLSLDPNDRNHPLRREDMTELEFNAFAVAARAHGGQTRKYTDEPYIVHPGEVVEVLTAVGLEDPELLAAAWLHDVVEDTDVVLETIEGMFGYEVASLVLALTDPPVQKGRNRKARKAETIKRLTAAGWKAQSIKCADIICNANSIRVYDPDFWVVFRREAAELLEAMTMADQTLRTIAYQIVADEDLPF